QAKQPSEARSRVSGVFHLISWTVRGLSCSRPYGTNWIATKTIKPSTKSRENQRIERKHDVPRGRRGPVASGGGISLLRRRRKRRILLDRRRADDPDVARPRRGGKGVA